MFTVINYCTAMSHRDFSENELEITADLPPTNKTLFLEKVRLSNEACQNGDFNKAVLLYSDAINLDSGNYVLFSNRSAAYLKQGHFSLALEDANKTRELQPNWPKAYFRQGVALQCLGRFGDALAAFSEGLSLDNQNKQLLGGLLEASVKSPMKNAIAPTLDQLKNMSLDQSPFVVISVIGQELLQTGQFKSAVTVLESALKIGSCSLKLRGSVFSALSSAYWALNQLDKAIYYMQQDLMVAKSLNDTLGECRAYKNLGSAYFSQGLFKEALTSHRYQLVLAMKCRDTEAAANALTSLGHVYTAVLDYPNALASHKQCVQLVKQIGDRLQEAREIGNVGAVYLAMGEFDSAVDCHTQHLKIASKLGNYVEVAKAYSNLGSSFHFRRNFVEAIKYHEEVLKIAEELGDKSIKSRAYAGLGHACRCSGNLPAAKRWHEKQLEMALSARDKVGEARAVSNLGIVYQLMSEHNSALKLHQSHLEIARHLNDRAGMGRAYGNIGIAYSSSGLYEQAISCHKHELSISKEVSDKSAQASTHGNLAVAYQALGSFDMALFHYRAHLGIAKEIKDTTAEACALLNLGNCLSSQQEFSAAVPYYEKFLELGQELGDVSAEAKACHFLGYAHYCIGNFREAIRYYDQDLALAKDTRNKNNMGRAYCNLGLAHLALNNLQEALECQKYFLTIVTMTNHVQGKFRALGNIGDIYLKLGETDDALKMYFKQLVLARQLRDKALECTACEALGLVHKILKNFDKSLGFLTQELTITQELGDIRGETRVHGFLGTVHMSLGNYSHAVKCYQEQLERAREQQNYEAEAQSYGNLAIAKLNMGLYDEAIGYLEQQLATLERLNSHSTHRDKARALRHLGECYEALCDYEEAIKCHENNLKLATLIKSFKDQEQSLRGLGYCHKQLGNFQTSLVSYEKRLVVSHEIGSPQGKAAAYGDLGLVHCILKNFQQAINCIKHQSEIAKSLNDSALLSDANSTLGSIYLEINEINMALEIHLADYETCEFLKLHNLQSRACGNLGKVYERKTSYKEAIDYFERQLNLTTEPISKVHACESLGRVYNGICEFQRATSYLQQGLEFLQSLNKMEEEATLRFQYGLSLFASDDTENARLQLESTLTILESKSLESSIWIYSLQTKCYNALQKILITLCKYEDALLIAEKSKSAMFFHNNAMYKSRPTTLDTIYDTVDKLKSFVIYYSSVEFLGNIELYIWFLRPGRKVVRFHSSPINETIFYTPNIDKNNILDSYIHSIRESLGVNSLEDSDMNWRSSTENLLENSYSDRLLHRNTLMNSSSYSLSSLFSLGSVNGSVNSLQGSTRSIPSLHGSIKSNGKINSMPAWHGPSSLYNLYKIFLEPFDDLIPTASAISKTGKKDLILVLDNDFYLLPFHILCNQKEDSEYLSERCSIISVPCLNTFRFKTNPLKCKQETSSHDKYQSLVIGGPKMCKDISGSWSCSECPSLIQEALMVSDMLQCKPLFSSATKGNIISEIESAELIHFAVNVKWKNKAIILYPNEFGESTTTKYDSATNLYPENSSSGITFTEQTINLSDLKTLRLNAKIVVISSYNSDEQIYGKDVASLATSWLLAGAHSILISLWPVPETATKILLRAFYAALFQGLRIAKALSDAMQTVQHTKHFAHPANWAGFLLLGRNVRLCNRSTSLRTSLCDILTETDHCRDALRVCLHLIEKSLQRINRGQKNAMYTTEKSIENKAGTSDNGWKDLLKAVGFRFEPSSKGIPSSVFFPQSDPEERLSQCSSNLQALLALNPLSLQAISKLTKFSDRTDVCDVISIIRNITHQFNKVTSKPDLDSEQYFDISLQVNVWRTTGCHELLASLGFDLMDVGENQVTLRTGKQVNRRNCTFVLHSLLALFDTPDPLYSSTESLIENNLDTILPDKSSSAGQSCVQQINKSLLHSSVNSAFRYYRGEPDGDFSKGTVSTVDSNSVNGYISQKSFLLKNNLADFTYLKPVSSIKCSYRGESDAAFTPSPPVNISHNINIQTTYQQSFNENSSTSDISQSDWDISGHSTVLRKSIYGNRKNILKNKAPALNYYTEKEDNNANNTNSTSLSINSILREFNKSIAITESDQTNSDDIYQLRRHNGDGKSKEEI